MREPAAVTRLRRYLTTSMSASISTTRPRTRFSTPTLAWRSCTGTRRTCFERWASGTTRRRRPGFSQDEANRLIQRAADGEPQTFHWQIERSNGELRWVRIHLSSTCIDGDRCVISEVQDVTESRARERRLRLLSRIIRHNLRNKTNVIMGYADRVRQAVEDETIEQRSRRSSTSRPRWAG